MEQSDKGQHSLPFCLCLLGSIPCSKAICSIFSVLTATYLMFKNLGNLRYGSPLTFSSNMQYWSKVYKSVSIYTQSDQQLYCLLPQQYLYLIFLNSSKSLRGAGWLEVSAGQKPQRHVFHSTYLLKEVVDVCSAHRWNQGTSLLIDSPCHTKTLDSCRH